MDDYDVVWDGAHHGCGMDELLPSRREGRAAIWQLLDSPDDTEELKRKVRLYGIAAGFNKPRRGWGWNRGFRVRLGRGGVYVKL